MLTLLRKLNFSNLMLCILHGRNPQSAFPYRTPQRHFIVKKKIIIIIRHLIGTGKTMLFLSNCLRFFLSKKKIQTCKLISFFKDFYKEILIYKIIRKVLAIILPYILILLTFFTKIF